MPFPLTIQHINDDTGEIMKSEVKTIEDLETIIVKAKDFKGLHYRYFDVSKDGGNSWGNRSDKTSRTITRRGGDLIIDEPTKSKALKNGIGSAGINSAALVASNMPNEEDVAAQQNQMELNVFYLNEKELGVNIITENSKMTYDDIKEPIARAEEKLKLPVKEINYYNHNGDLLKVERLI